MREVKTPVTWLTRVGGGWHGLHLLVNAVVRAYAFGLRAFVASSFAVSMLFMFACDRCQLKVGLVVTGQRPHPWVFMESVGFGR